MEEKKKPKIKMRAYEPIHKEKENYNFCSVLQAILKRQGIEVSQDEIAANLTPSEDKFVADDERVEEFFRQRGFSYVYYQHNQTPCNERDTLLKKIHDNDGFVSVDGQAYLLSYFKDPWLELIDVEHDERRERDIYSIIAEMSWMGGGFGLIKKLE
ncbi:MAG: hypothetical protein QF496_00045 [Dehalococcoidia bacterium]|nr:hypothetical protein [Dehalococcoidia bacterium]